jgi:hypothetical protein
VARRPQFLADLLPLAIPEIGPVLAAGALASAGVERVDQGYTVVVFKAYAFVTSGRTQSKLADAAA